VPTAIISGLPLDIDRRVQKVVSDVSPFPPNWTATWLRSNGRTPGLAPSQVDEVLEVASQSESSHILIFQGRSKAEERSVFDGLIPFFRVRWLEQTLLKLIPHNTGRFFEEVNSVLAEELQWNETVKPSELSCCLLLPQCAFAADKAVRHVWTAATERGAERIKLAARVSAEFRARHWLPSKAGARVWIDAEGRIFDHRGVRHGLAPFPRGWKFSYKIANGFHFDVTSMDARAFGLLGSNLKTHTALAGAHVNIDPHGYVR
jgi:hypothetical protein